MRQPADHPQGSMARRRAAGNLQAKPHLYQHLSHQLTAFLTLALAAVLLAGLVLDFARPQPAQAAAGTWSLTGWLNSYRRDHTATLLPDGQVLVTGGHVGSFLYLPNAELYNPATGKWSNALGGLSTVRYCHTATRLLDGRVLIVGGANEFGTPLNTADIFNPSDGTWSPTGPLGHGRLNHKATLLADGRVLVTGGQDWQPMETAEVFNPTKNEWTATTNPLVKARYNHSATLLPDGRVLVAGGWGFMGALDTTEIYDPDHNTWSGGKTMPTVRYAHTATRLADGRVLLVGGGDLTGPLRSAELYLPGTNDWGPAPSSMLRARYYHTATALSALTDGRVLVVEGIGADGTMLTSSEIYNPKTNRWVDAGFLSASRDGHTATLLADGRVLVAGGESATSYPPSTELYAVGLSPGVLNLLLMD